VLATSRSIFSCGFGANPRLKAKHMPSTRMTGLAGYRTFSLIGWLEHLTSATCHSPLRNAKLFPPGYIFAGIEFGRFNVKIRTTLSPGCFSGSTNEKQK
jgi:hypothetical protein